MSCNIVSQKSKLRRLGPTNQIVDDSESKPSKIDDSDDKFGSHFLIKSRFDQDLNLNVNLSWLNCLSLQKRSLLSKKDGEKNHVTLQLIKIASKLSPTYNGFWIGQRDLF